MFFFFINLNQRCMSCQLQKVPIIGKIKLEEDFKVVFFVQFGLQKKLINSNGTLHILTKMHYIKTV